MWTHGEVWGVGDREASLAGHGQEAGNRICTCHGRKAAVCSMKKTKKKPHLDYHFISDIICTGKWQERITPQTINLPISAEIILIPLLGCGKPGYWDSLPQAAMEVDA
jgi:hypothetical protein